MRPPIAFQRQADVDRVRTSVAHQAQPIRTDDAVGAVSKRVVRAYRRRTADISTFDVLSMRLLNESP